MTRQEHLQWAKQRALTYVENNDLTSALGSIFSDLGKHPETADHPGIEIGAMLMITGNLSTSQQVRRFIEGFN